QRAGRRGPTWCRGAGVRRGWTCRRRRIPPWRVGVAWRLLSEVPLLLAVIHGGLGDAVVGPRCAALREHARGDLGHDRTDGAGARADSAGAGHVADRPVANRLRTHLLTGSRSTPRSGREEHAVALEHLTLVGVVESGELDPLPLDVAP